MLIQNLLRIDDVAQMLGVHYNTAYREVVRGNLPATKVGRVYRVDPRDLESYLARNRRVN